MQILESKITEACGLRYKIQLRNIDGIWQQRHIWYPPKGEPAYEYMRSLPDDGRPDEWIKSTQSTPDPRIYSPAL